jgi:CRISPR/Cas system CMR-associated protein Cmr1 (group 7 of RAMP superfamily)
MTSQEKREDKKNRIILQLRGKIRPHRPAAKVIEVAVALAEERIETMEDQKAELEWQLEYIKKLDPKELEQEEKS